VSSNSTLFPAPLAEPQLGQLLEEATRQERRQALRALLQRPLLRATGSDAAAFALVRRHAAWLREWLARNPCWSLQIDSEQARLYKTPADLYDDTRPARDVRSGAPFTRRRYVLLCLALAALERSDRQTTLGELAEKILDQTSGEPALAASGMIFTLEGRNQRRDLVQAVRLLLDLQVLIRVHGDEEQYLSHTGDVLYNVNRPALAAMLNVKRGPSSIDEATTTLAQRIAAICAEPYADSDSGRHRQLRTSLTRRLLDNPVLYFDELDEDEAVYLSSQRPFIIAQIEEATGLVAEIRREGIAMVDERGDLSDLALPEEGTDGHLTLLLAEHLAEHARRHTAGTPMSMIHLHRYTADLIEQHKSHWRKDVTEPGAEIRLTEQTVDRLQALRLVHRCSEGVLPLPAIGRFAMTGDPEAPLQASLWQESEL
jgi:uncharacterized protein (TIGR02678 family)